jgi:hypothetical protein
MHTTTQLTPAPVTAVESIDLVPYLRALLRARWLLVLAMLAGTGLGSFQAMTTPHQYQAAAKVSVVDIGDPGGVSPDDRRASEVLTLVEHGFVMGTTRDNYSDVMLARLRSRAFTMYFLDQHNLYRYFYPEQWSADTGEWVDGFVPDRGESFTRFSEEVRTISVDEETDIVSVAMRWTNPTLPAQWANLYVESFNAYMRARTQEEVLRKQEFLETRLRESDIVEIRQSIYRLIEAQTAVMMLANAREEYVLELIDPAARPYYSITMSGKKRVVIGALVALALALFTVLASTLGTLCWSRLRSLNLSPAQTEKGTGA